MTKKEIMKKYEYLYDEHFGWYFGPNDKILKYVSS